MVAEENKRGTRRGEFQLGRHWDQVGPEFGRLQEARHVRGARSGLSQGMGRAGTSITGRGLTIATLILLSLGVGFWLRGVGEVTRQDVHMPIEGWSNREGQGTAPIAYPLPKKPLPNQSTVPCNSKLAELEINGGCWMELARRPPCIEENQAEYQGKCYYPVAKKEEARPPQSVNP
ncbi:hypothetical protein CYFUS_004352 [Cystobacter fuscus]|uniref:Protein kinase n=1 Tax=Cystobacter fuscus TaxID=43 RepID=A0A250J4Q1_9BACT|nr:hypothetical protein [Cystobacter fuscus]ATB38915.1 hypothetical protein CYFUS_004352 [Cystobacter fuscus]